MEGKNKIKPKFTSFIGQIFSSLWIAIFSAYKFIYTKNIEIQDVILSGIGIVSCFSPIYFSIILDKIKDIKWGNND